MINGNAIVATWRRQLAALLGNPLAYVFILAFVLATVFIMFWEEDFFNRNIADLEPLRHYILIPLVILIPALAMGSWASERELGTEEQLLSLPMTLADVLLGKWLGIATFFTVTLLFSISNVFILAYLGDPDLGLIFAQYVGWWFAGLHLISVAILASCLVSMPAIAFVIGAGLCSISAAALHYSQWLEPFQRGVIPLPSLLMTVLLVLAPLGVAGVLLSLRRWQEKHASRHMQVVISALCFVVVAFNVFVLLDRLALDIDVTEEHLSTLSDTSKNVLKGIERPVEIVAFISADMPPGKNASLSNKAREVERMIQSIDRYAGSQIQMQIERPRDVVDEIGVKATEHYGLRPKKVEDDTVSGKTMVDVFLGAVVRSGAQTQIIEHFDPGLSVEYELIRAIHAVGHDERKVIGVVETPLRVTGGYDFQARQMRREWELIRELRKQYDIRSVKLDSPLAEDIDGLLVVQASQLMEEEIHYLHDAIWEGVPTLILEDPMPYFTDADMGSSRGRVPPQQNPMQPQQQPPPLKGNIHPLVNALGLQFVDTDIVWSTYSISHEFRDMFPKEFVWSYRDVGGINEQANICTGIDGLLFPFPGALSKSVTAPAELEYTELVTAVPNNAWGRKSWGDYMQRGFMGMQFTIPERYTPSFGNPPAFAMSVQGQMKRAYDFQESAEDAEEAESAENPEEEAADDGASTGKGELSSEDIHVVFIADTDFAHDNFYMLYRDENNNFSEQGMTILRDLRNVQFVANAMDELLSSESGFMALRTRRPMSRPLTTINKVSQEQRDKRIKAVNEFREELQAFVDEQEEQKKERLQQIDARQDIDANTKQQIKAQAEVTENRRTMAAIAEKERVLNRKMKLAEVEERRVILSKRREVRWMAIGLPAVILIMLIMTVYFVRLREEQMAVPEERQRSVS